MGVLVPRVTVVLDRERVLVEDFGALARFEEKTGLNALDPETFTKTVRHKPAPCPSCRSKAIAGRENAGITYRCKRCDHTWPAVERTDAMTAKTFSAYLWALLGDEDPRLTLEEVRRWLGDPKLLGRAKLALAELEAAQTASVQRTEDEEVGDDADPLSQRGPSSTGSPSLTSS